MERHRAGTWIEPRPILSMWYGFLPSHDSREKRPVALMPAPVQGGEPPHELIPVIQEAVRAVSQQLAYLFDRGVRGVVARLGRLSLGLKLCELIADLRDLRGFILPEGLFEALFEVVGRSEEHTSELQSRQYLVCR